MIHIIIEAPSYAAISQHQIITNQIRKTVELMLSHSNFRVTALLDRPPETHAEKKKVGIQLRELYANFPQTNEKRLLLGSKLCQEVLGLQPDAAWGAPSISNTDTTTWGFFSLDAIFGYRAILQPMFRTLLRRIDAFKDATPYDWGHVETYANAEALRILQGARDVVAVDIEDNSLTGQIMRLGIATHEGVVSLPWDEYESGKWGWQTPLAQESHGRECEAEALRILSDPTITKIGHNVAYDVNQLTRRGINIAGPIEDTIVQHHILWPDAPHALGFVGAQFLGCEPWKAMFAGNTEEKGLAKFVKRDPQELAHYNAKDAVATLRAWVQMNAILNDSPDERELYTNMTRVCDAARKMSLHGMLIDEGVRDKLKSEMDSVIQKTKSVVDEIVHRNMGIPVGEFNISSGAHLRNVLYNHFKIEPDTFTPSGMPSVDDVMLQKCIANSHPDIKQFAHNVLNFKRALKLKSTFIDSLDIKGGRVHPDWKPFGAKTDRWACKNPNVQNQPKIVRKMFVAPPGQWLVYADWSQLELRIAAAVARDVPLLDTFDRGIRVHTANARAVFSKGEDWKPTEEQEKVAKGVVYASQYGAGAATIASNLRANGLNVTDEFAERLLENWYRAHPALKEYFANTFKAAQRDGFLPIYRSKRRLFFYGGVNPQDTSNWPIQGCGAQMANRALLRMSEVLRLSATPHSSIIAQIHDAFIVETSDVIEASRMLTDAMCETWEVETPEKTFNLKFNIGLSVGRDWYNLTEYKTLAAVEAAAKEGKFK